MEFNKARSAEPSSRPFPMESPSKTGVRVASLTDMDTSTRVIVARALTSTGANGAALAMLRDGDMVCVATAGSDVPPLGSRLQMGSGFSAQCVHMRCLLRCDDSGRDLRVDRESCLALDIRSIVAAPIIENEFVIGLLEVFSPRVSAFDDSDSATLEMLAKSLLVAINRRSPVQKGDYSKLDKCHEERDRALAPNVANNAVTVDQHPVPAYYKVIAVFVCALVIVASFWIVGRVRGWFPAPAPDHTDAQIALSEPPSNASGPALQRANELINIRKLAEQGDSAAQFALGARYATGEDIQQDYTQAALWFTRAAEQGHVLAQATLGAYFWAGRGVASDLSKAYFWSVVAQAGGDQASEYRVAILKSRLSPSQISVIKQEASDWLNRHQQSSQTQLSIR
jgi:GAF domain/Sel1 repeat